MTQQAINSMFYFMAISAISSAYYFVLLINKFHTELVVLFAEIQDFDFHFRTTPEAWLNLTTTMVNVTTPTPRTVEDEVLLGLYLLVMLTGSITGSLGTVALCRRYRKATINHLFFYHACLLELTINLTIVNARAAIILFGSIGPEERCGILTQVDWAMNSMVILTLLTNLAHCSIEQNRGERKHLLQRRGAFACVSLFIWIWPLLILIFPPFILVQTVHFGYADQCIWDTRQEMTWYFVVICVLCLAIVIPTLGMIAIGIKMACDKNKQKMKVTPREPKRIKRLTDAWADVGKEEDKAIRKTSVWAVVVHSVFCLLGYTGLALLWVIDTDRSASLYLFSFGMIAARASAVLGLLLHIVIDKELQQELGIGVMCLEESHTD